MRFLLVLILAALGNALANAQTKKHIPPNPGQSIGVLSLIVDRPLEVNTTNNLQIIANSDGFNRTFTISGSVREKNFKVINITWSNTKNPTVLIVTIGIGLKGASSNFKEVIEVSPSIQKVLFGTEQTIIWENTK